MFDVHIQEITIRPQVKIMFSFNPVWVFGMQVPKNGEGRSPCCSPTSWREFLCSGQCYGHSRNGFICDLRLSTPAFSAVLHTRQGSLTAHLLRCRKERLQEFPRRFFYLKTRQLGSRDSTRLKSLGYKPIQTKFLIGSSPVSCKI